MKEKRKEGEERQAYKIMARVMSYFCNGLQSKNLKTI
jgi:hypothetical protein